VREITEALCGTTFSKSLVSELAGQLDAELDAWRNRPLTETSYPYLSVDARYEHVRRDGQIVSQGVLIVAGVRADGHREILGVAVADTESESTYHHLFRELQARGLSGVRLITSDDHRGLKAAIDRHFQGASWQRCQVHFAREIVKFVGAGRRGELAADLREIFAATTREQAMTTAEAVAARWEPAYPAVARLLEQGIEDCLACLAFPLAHRVRIRTTNGLERLNEEVKRRTRVVRIFPNTAACLRLVTALCVEQSEEWMSGRRYLEMSHLIGPTREPGPMVGDGMMAGKDVSGIYRPSVAGHDGVL
jgi:putative transposase